MDRVDYILQMQPIANNLAKHYGHPNDEDLIQDGVVGIIRGVDWCLKQDKEWTIEEMGKVCNTFAKRTMLHELRNRNKQLEHDDVDDYYDFVVAPNDFEFHLMLLSCLDDRELLLYRHLVMGEPYDSIQQRFGISKSEFYRQLKSIKEKVKSLGK